MNRGPAMGAPPVRGCRMPDRQRRAAAGVSRKQAINASKVSTAARKQLSSPLSIGIVPVTRGVTVALRHWYATLPSVKWTSECASRSGIGSLSTTTLPSGMARACAEGAAHQTGTRLELVRLEGESPPLRANLPLAALYRRQLERLDLSESAHAPDESIGSSDITHVSRVVPTIHPNFPIGSELKLHTRAFAEAAASPAGEAGMLEGARALALCVLELARDPEVRAAVAREHDRSGRAA